jgi:PAS domain S-box-containing protein
MTLTANNSIKRKVMRVIMLASIAVLLVAAMAFMIFDLVTFRQTMVQNLRTQARMIAENSSAALAFKNESDATNVLASLKSEPHITAAAFYDSQGKVFAKYPATISDSDLPGEPEKEGHHFSRSHLTLFQEIDQGGTPMGTLYLQSNLTALSQRLQLYGAISSIIVAGSLFVAFWLSNLLQRRISDPIIGLAEMVRKISEQHNYSLRAPALSDDELGLLTDSFNDMLERIQTSDSALRASEAQFRLVTNQAPVLLAHIDLNYCYKFVNRAYAHHYGFKPEEIIGKTAIEVVGPELFERARPFIEKVFSGKTVQFELEITGASHERRWSHAEYTPEKSSQGEVVGFVAVHTDITSRKQHEADLAELVQQKDAQARLFDATLSSITDLAYTFDLEGNWIYANKPLLQIWGKALPEIVGKSSLELGYPTDLAERLKQQVKEVVQTRKSVRGETYFTDASGIEDYHEYILSPVLAADGNVTAVCGTTRLATERKRAEKEIEHARDQALAASRAKDEFLAALSHELRTPLNPVLLVASDAASNPDMPADARANFEMIRRNVELEARLIDDLLDLTRITRGKLILDKHPLDVREVLRDAIAIVQADAETKRIELIRNFEATALLILGDSVRLQQIFWNILKNAVKFTPERGSITIRAMASPESGKISLSITDTGIGLTSDEIGHIFDAFAQGDHATGSSHRFGGLGLGLTISRMLVESHAGSLQATSAGRDQGATFVVEFPALPAAGLAAKSSVSEPAELSAIPTLKIHSGRRILLVEDHEPTRTALASLLTRRDYKVLTAVSVAEARALARQNQFDLVVSDIGLPDGDGYALMSGLRDEFGLKGIALSGYGMEKDVAKGKQAGFIAHLVKPVRVESLEKVLETIS